MILIIYLTIFAGVNQLTAQGINLVFFIPIALLSIFLHSRNKLIEWKKIVPIILFGTIGVFVGSIIATKISTDILSKIFAVFLIFIGFRELFTKPH